MKNLKWFFPDTLSEVDKLLEDGYKAHGGGTFLVKTSLNAKGLFDLSRIAELKEFRGTDDSFILGSALSYTEAAGFLESKLPGNLLSAALSSAAACPLRNRITLGGSIYASPKWSDIIGPLFAAEASLRLSSKVEPVSVADYHSDKKIRQSGIITEVIIPKANIDGSYYRFTQTHFDYPFFTISASDRGGDILHCCLTGSKDGPMLLTGRRADLNKTSSSLPEFSRERGLSGEYIRNRAGIELQRLIKLTGGNNNG